MSKSSTACWNVVFVFFLLLLLLSIVVNLLSPYLHGFSWKYSSTWVINSTNGVATFINIIIRLQTIFFSSARWLCLRLAAMYCAACSGPLQAVRRGRQRHKCIRFKSTFCLLTTHRLCVVSMHVLCGLNWLWGWLLTETNQLSWSSRMPHLMLLAEVASDWPGVSLNKIAGTPSSSQIKTKTNKQKKKNIWGRESERQNLDNRNFQENSWPVQARAICSSLRACFCAIIHLL